MSTVTSNPARTDLTPTEAGHPDRTTPSRAWALAGVGAGLLGAATVVLSGAADAMADGSAPRLALHSVTGLSAVLLLLFAAGLHRRLRTAAPDSLGPVVSLVGLAGTAVVSILASGLDTEFALTGGDVRVDDATAAFRGHGTGTIAWLWTLAGPAGLAVFAVSRGGGVARWQGRVGLVLGGLTVLLGVSPMDHVAGLTGVLWVLVASLGFALGERR
ncbi:hypothetical protein [Nocardioides anomalus]|uniref:hypothetical protein n=1 Tax=Nocardioides anomalus TaxID=2712223 RepID=UPI0018AD3F60|nr:hypothetical protein [Nocardioides anomalus]